MQTVMGTSIGVVVFHTVIPYSLNELGYVVPGGGGRIRCSKSGNWPQMYAGGNPGRGSACAHQESGRMASNPGNFPPGVAGAGLAPPLRSPSAQPAPATA
jgi:hypothetical protein